jgi:predicted acylesterase/phospholipase RssA
MVIKHLVLSGGGPTGFLTYGAACYLAKENFWSLANIKSMYGCSIGGFMAVILSLGYDWEILDDYFIKRPWDKLMASSTISIIDVYEQKGLINEHFFIDSITPLLRGKDLDETITMAQLFAFNQIDIHLFSTNLNSTKLEKVDISHSTFPNLSVVKALQMTMAIPIVFKPIFEGDGCYIDGGLLNNYPLNDCIKQQQCEKDEILAFKNIWTYTNPVINEKSSIIDFMLIMMRKTQMSLDTEPEQEEIKHTVRCLVDELLNGFDKWLEILSREDIRKKVIERGYKQAEIFLAYLKKV